MRIINFSANNVMRLTAVDITPEGNTVILAGRNRSGKTSILRSIAAVLEGAKNRPDALLHRGADKGDIRLTIGNSEPDLIVHLKVTEAGETLTVTTASGAKHQAPQAILDTLRSAVGFEPMSFLQMGRDAEGRKKQAAMLAKLVGINHTILDSDRQKYFDERTAVNREVKQARTVWDAAVGHTDVPKEEISVLDATERLRVANEHNAKNEDARALVSTLAEKGARHVGYVQTDKDELVRLLKMVEEKQQAIAMKEAELVTIRADYKSANDTAKILKDIDPQPIQWDIERAEDTNRKVRANKQKAMWLDQLNEKEAESAELTKKIEAIEKTKAKELSEANFPLPGLAFNSDGITYNGFDLSAASGAEQLLIAMGIGSGLNPKLRVLLFRDAALLDADSRKIVEDYAAEHDTQIWLECIQEEAGSIVICDGSVKGQP